jgi:hypothetical protein
MWFNGFIAPCLFLPGHPWCYALARRIVSRHDKGFYLNSTGDDNSERKQIEIAIKAGEKIVCE